MTDYVLDASAILALWREEPGGDVVAARASGAAVSAVNAAEAVAKYVDKGGTLELALFRLRALELAILPFDEAMIARTAALKALCRGFGISFADRACLAVAQAENLTALTADREWARLPFDVRVELIR